MEVRGELFPVEGTDRQVKLLYIGNTDKIEKLLKQYPTRKDCNEAVNKVNSYCAGNCGKVLPRNELKVCAGCKWVCYACVFLYPSGPH